MRDRTGREKEVMWTRAAFIEPEVNSLAAVPACCREFEDPVDPRLLLESLLSKLFPFLKDLFMVSASSTFATTALTERPSNLRFSLPPSESRHFHPLAIVVSMITASRERLAQVSQGALLSATMPSNGHPFPSQILLLPGLCRPKVGLLFLPCTSSGPCHQRGDRPPPLSSFLSITTRRLSRRLCFRRHRGGP